MNNPPWRAEDGQLLRHLRELAGIDALVFARNNTLSLAQLKELELGGNSSFYNPDIKQNTGVKLLKKLGHEWVAPAQVDVTLEPTGSLLNESARAKATEEPLAANNHPTRSFDSDRRRLIQPVFFGSLALLGMMTLTIFKPWDLVHSWASDKSSTLLDAQASSSLVATAAASTTWDSQSLVASTSPDTVLGFAPSAVDARISGARALVPSVTATCDWQHRGKGKSHTPTQPIKAGNYVHLVAQADTELCVLDSQNKKTLLQLKTGMAKSVYGVAPFLVHSPDLHTLKLFFQGRRVQESLDNMQYLLLNSQSQ